MTNGEQRKWLDDNKIKIEAKLREAQLIQEQLNENRLALIKKWKLKDILFQSNWSLKTFNLYLLTLNNLNFTTDAHFEGFTIVLTDNSVPGLRKNGSIHLNCGQVYEQWLGVRIYLI